MLTAMQRSGCLGIGRSTKALDIPLEHITSTGTEKSGCIFKRGIITLSSGAATDSVMLSKPRDADEASMTLQRILRERRR